MLFDHDAAASRQVLTGEAISLFQSLGSTFKGDSSAAFAGCRTDFDDVVCFGEQFVRSRFVTKDPVAG